MSRRAVDYAALAAGFLALAGATAAFHLWLDASNPTIVSLIFLLIVLVIASVARLWVAVVMSVAAMLAFNYFFLPPVGTFTISDPQNWVALFTFLAVSLVASNLSAAARARAQEAHARRDELSRLFDLSRDVLVMTDSQALSALARSMAARFGLDFVAIALPAGRNWQRFEAGPRHTALDEALLSRVFADASGTVEFDARARTYSGHALHTVGGATARIAPLRLGVKPIGLLAAVGAIEPGTLDVLGGIAALAIERARFLEERKSAELTRQREELKTALLASLGHDLRTPLTAIRVAAANLGGDWLAQADRIEQADVILAEAERLTRLFQNILDMARIDAGPVATSVTLVPPADIIAAARDQVEHALRRHRVVVELQSDEPVRLDPRLTAAALAHLLENAAQYSPPGSAIRVSAGRAGAEWRVTVTDAGPGISPEDRPHLFDRFFRGAAAAGRPSGLGMGLSIARGLLAAEGGRVWAEDAPAGGAAFTIAVPVVSGAESAAEQK